MSRTTSAPAQSPVADRFSQWLAADRPYVIDFRTDPAVPPIPPHASLDQIEAAASAVLHGDSDRVGMVRQGIKAKVQEMLPGHRDRADRPGAED
jgi:pyruvate dehydrogenase (quinone)